MTVETLPTFSDFIAAHGLRMKATRVESNPKMVADARWHSLASHYRCTITGPRGRMVVPFSQGSAHTSKPKLEDVLSCLASDAASAQNATGFEDWCADFGYETDSRVAESTFQTCKSIHARLLRLLGVEGLETLLYGTEPL